MRSFHLLGLVALLFACTPAVPSDEHPPSHAPIAAAELAARWKEAICAPYIRCGVMADQELCETFLRKKPIGRTAIDGPERIAAAVVAGKVAFDGDRARACLDAITARACEESNLVAPDAFPACDGMLGRKADVTAGAACNVALECPVGQRCSASGACPGTCVDATGCVLHTDCAAGQVCEDGRCTAARAPGVAGAPCGNFDRCAAGFACAGGKCVPLPVEGQGCMTLGSCANGLYCNNHDGKCHRPLPTGAPCELLPRTGVEAEMSCAFELIPRVCDTATLTCIDLPTSGPCRTTGPTCDYFRAFCDTSVTPATCRPTKGVGEVCTSSKECAGELHERTCGAADAQGVQRCEARAPATCP